MTVCFSCSLGKSLDLTMAGPPEISDFPLNAECISLYFARMDPGDEWESPKP